MAITLLDKVDANTIGSNFIWKGGPSQLVVTGDSFGGGNVIIELSEDGVIYFSAKFSDGTDFVATDNDSFPVCGWSQGIIVRATLQGATSPSNVTVTARQG